jgi:hypothetical protein
MTDVATDPQVIAQSRNGEEPHVGSEVELQEV